MFDSGKGSWAVRYNLPRLYICFDLLLHNLVRLIFSLCKAVVWTGASTSTVQKVKHDSVCAKSSISSSSSTHRGENENKWKHPLKMVFLLYQDHWLCDARDDFWDKFTKNRESFDTERTRATVLLTLQVRRKPCTWIVLCCFKLRIHYTNKQNRCMGKGACNALLYVTQQSIRDALWLSLRGCSAT